MNDDQPQRELTLVQARDVSSELARHTSRPRAYIEAARSPATRRAYAADWAQFINWCAIHALSPLPATPPTRTATSRPICGGRRRSSRRCRAFAGIRNTHGARPTQKHAANGEQLGQMLAAITGDDVRSARDRALLAIEMAAALRRSELVALTVADVQVVPDGLRLFVARSKTDQAGQGVWIAVPEGRRIRPKALLLDWLRVGYFTNGPIFRKLAKVRVARRDASGAVIRDGEGRVVRERLEDRVQPLALSAQGVALIVKARACAAGLDPSLFAGHSLRSGFLTEAARQPGANIFKMRKVSLHKSLDILAFYVREHDGFRDHAGERFL